MVKFVWGLIKTSRPRQWIKNFAIFAGLIFSGQLDNPESIWFTIYAFMIFCALSGATYFINDSFDVDRDKEHPFKSKRPIAAGIIPVPVAIGIALVIISITLPITYNLSMPLFYSAATYLVLQLFYSAYLKSVILLDVMVIAAGFVLRVYAGVWALDAHLNVWFLLCVISFSLFLAIGKRRSELTLMAGSAAKHRETLLHYPSSLLDILTSMFANSTWLTYALFAFQQPPIAIKGNVARLFDITTLPFTEAKYLMATVPVVIYAVMRYLYIIYEKREGESPERVLLTDQPLLASVVLWLGMILVIIYYLGG